MQSKEEIQLNELYKEQKILEQQISDNRKRIAEIRAVTQGSGKTPGLSSVVDMQKRRQEWIDGEPERAAMRATPEWQEWRNELMKGKL
jgi:hypothetical protein